jgi:nucleoside-diphosphate-sugar epimerase
LRPAWVYGPGCPRTMKLFRTLKKRRFVMIGSGGNLRHPVFIGDFIAACKLTLDSANAVGEVTIIAGPKALTTSELIDGFCRALDLPRPNVHLPYAIGRCLAAGAEAVFGLLHKAPPISRRSLEFFDTDNAFDIKKATRTLGFEPAYDLPQGLALTRNWLEQRGMNVMELVATGVS